MMHEEAQSIRIIAGQVTIEGTLEDGTPITLKVPRFISNHEDAIQMVEVWDHPSINPREGILAVPRGPDRSLLRLELPIFVDDDGAMIRITLEEKS